MRLRRGGRQGTAGIMNEGMRYLLEKLGTVETEIFIRGEGLIPHCLQRYDKGVLKPSQLPREKQHTPLLAAGMLISHILREPFNYTKWRRDTLYADMSLHELNQNAAEYSKGHPFRQKESAK
jgi:hypothetical protein